jgi:hypothetical protein
MTGSELVMLRHGLTVPVRAIELALDLERRGVHLELDGADILVGPRDRITDDDRQQIRALKPFLLVLVAYVNREAIQ